MKHPCIGTMFFILSCFSPHNIYSQELSDKKEYLQVVARINEFYTSKKALGYKFHHVYYLSNGKKLSSDGKVVTCHTNNTTQYRLLHTYQFKNLQFEGVRNAQFFGANFFQDSTYRNFNTIPGNKRFYPMYNRPEDVLSPQSDILKLLLDTNYSQKVIFRNSMNIILELKDTTRRQKVTGHVTTKKTRRYYLSPEDHRIVRMTISHFWSIGDFDQSDSSETNYEYFSVTRNKAVRYINSFKPFAKLFDEFPSPDQQDTVTIFPAYNLPDENNKLQEISAPYVLVDFWYKDCAPCLLNIRKLSELDRKNLKIVLINTRDKVDASILKMIAKYNDLVFLFEGKELAARLGVKAYPTTYIYKNDRQIIFKALGLLDDNSVEDFMKEYVLENRVPGHPE